MNYKTGDIFQYNNPRSGRNGEYYLLCIVRNMLGLRVGPHSVVSLVGIKKGDLWCEGTAVEDPDHITKTQFRKITEEFTKYFKLIPNAMVVQEKKQEGTVAVSALRKLEI